MMVSHTRFALSPPPVHLAVAWRYEREVEKIVAGCDYYAAAHDADLAVMLSMEIGFHEDNRGARQTDTSDG